MYILAVEEDWRDRKRLGRLLQKALPEAEIALFASTKDAFSFVKERPIAAAFIDMGRSIHIPGYFLAQSILKTQRTNIIFTNYEWEYTQEALELRVSGYIRKPLQYEDIVHELQNLRYPITEAGGAIWSSPYTDNSHGLIDTISGYLGRNK